MTSPTNPSRRLFYALWPDAITRDKLLQLQAPIQGRKTRFENFHLTLAFLGQQPDHLLPALEQIMTSLPQYPITLELNRIGYFKESKIAWAGTHATPVALTVLHDNLLRALSKNMINVAGQSAFRPHITLARDAPPPDDLPFPSVTWHSEKIALIESRTQSDCVAYHMLTSVPL